MRRLINLFLALLVVVSSFATTVEKLRCETLINPEGIATATPRLSWVTGSSERNVVQTGYVIIVSSSIEKLNRNEGDLWNTGFVKSSESINIRYAGTPLTSRSQAYWKVTVSTNKGDKTESNPAKFSIGLLDKTDWSATWIGLDRAFEWDSETADSRLSARYFRKEFSAKKNVRSAKVYISGLGLYELYVNGTKIGDDVLAPSPTDYTKSVLYNTFDVTAQIRNGKNAIGAILGNGRFYNVRQNFKPQKIKTFGYPKMLLQLEITYNDGTKEILASDKTWKVTSDGPIRSNNDFNGEEYDARKELGNWNTAGYNDSKWLKVESVEPPGGKIIAQMNENMKVMRDVKPMNVFTRLSKDTIVLDMGQNMVGWLQLSVSGKAGDKISMRFAETVDTNHRVRMENLRSAKATDVYTLKGGGEEVWEPRFVTRGFRYVEVSGDGVEKLTSTNFLGKVVYDNIAQTGSFASSNNILNSVYHNVFWGIMGNYKGIPIDCPQRDERQPWLGDRTVSSLSESYMFDNQRLYAKWLDDIEQSQTPEGQLSDIAPPYYMTYYSDNMTWPAAYFTIADMLYTQYGDSEPITKHYASMRKWLEYMKRYMTSDYIVTKDKYGDWCVPPESKELIHSNDPARKTDGELIATAYYIKLLQLMQKFAMSAEQPSDSKEYAELEGKMKTAFNKKFYNPETGQYSNHTVTANLLPLAFGIVEQQNEERVFQNMIYRIVVDDKLHISTGIIGTQWLLRELSARGRTDVAYAIASQTTYPSWGYMVEKGATTIWELWNGDTASSKMNSHNHTMLLGDLVAWIYQDLAGIRTHKNQPGFKMLWMKPNPTEDLTYVEAYHETPYGNVGSEWSLEDDIFRWNLTIPANTRANILIPAENLEDITESGKPVTEVEGLKYVRKEEGRINLEIGSGCYNFVCKYGEAQNRWRDGIVTQEFICANPPFPESHAATIVQNKDGKMVASWFGGTKERNPDVCIWVSTLENGTWSAPRNVANGIVNDTTRHATWNPVLYQIPGGELQLYYKVGPNVAAWVGKVITSNDGGATWSEPKNLPDGFLGPIKNKPVLLKDGTLIAPSSREGSGGWRFVVESTKDFGKNWSKIPDLKGNGLDAIQPSLLIHKDGKLQMLGRTKNRVIAQTWSSDNGKTWSTLTPTQLPNNNSGTDAVTLRDGRQLIVYNHVLPNDSLPNGKGARTPLNVAISEDGKTWYAAAVLEDSPISQYSYPSVIQTDDGMVHIVYTWRREAIKYVKIDPSKLVLSKIEDMKWPSLSESSKVQVVNSNRYKVSVCDWMILKRQKVGAMELAREIGADGVEIDMGGLGSRQSFDNKLTDSEFQRLFISECNRLGVQFSSIAISAFYGQSFAKRDNYEALIDETIATMKAMGIKVAFLPLGNQSDIVKDPELYSVVVERLKVVAKKAEAAGVIFGIETTLAAKDEAALIDKIGSPGIRSYVNFSSVIKRGGNIIDDLKTLGKNRIVQIHVSNTDGYWIENDPALNMDKVKQSLDAMGWSGWLVVERSRDVNDVHNVKRNYGANVKYLKSVFQK